MASDSHTIASLEGSHYQVTGDRGEISEQTHPNDARRRRLPTWRARVSAVMKEGFFLLSLLVICCSRKFGSDGEKIVKRKGAD